MNISLLHIASFIAIFQALLMAIVSLQNKKGQRKGNLILATMLIVLATVGSCSLYKSVVPLGTHMRFHRQIFLVGQLAFLVGPLLFFYVKSLLDAHFVMRKWDWLHFLPFPLAALGSIIVFQEYEPFLIWKFPGRVYFSGAVLVQNLVYCLASFNILRSYGLTLRSFISYIDDAKLNWIRVFVGGYIVLWIVQLQVFMAWDVLESPPWCPYARSLYFLTTFLLFNGLVLIGLKKPEIFHQGRKYEYSILKNTDKEQYREKLNSLMDRERLYLNPSISLAEIAERLDIAPRYVSQIINETYQRSFHDFVNKYRIDESKRLLLQKNQNLNILGIALDAGFNSKSAFNNAFKRHEGVTPKEFRKRMSNKAAS
jgi:AraC-like DNA-binding protein